MAIVGDAEKRHKDFYDEIDDALKEGWVKAITIHKAGLSFCILYKEESWQK